MPGTCVIGLQWGDEAKGKLVDILTAKHDIVVRYQGGANAGHTVVIGAETYKLHHIPSGILNSEAINLVCPGVVLNPPTILEEIHGLEQRGVELTGRLMISDRVHVVFPWHLEEDRVLNERPVNGENIGTTLRGIGPCYRDKVGRSFAVRLGDMYREDFAQKVERIVAAKDRMLAGIVENGEVAPMDAAQISHDYYGYAEQLKPYVTDTTTYLLDAVEEDRRILFEGAQGSLLDIDHGTYPFVTSSNSSGVGISAGSGVAGRWITHVLGVVKSYSTRVGGGPFPTELKDETGDRIRDVGNEYGTTTGRPRRCGWFDAVAVRYTARLGGVDALSVMMLDVLSRLPEVKICVAYELDGETIDYLPSHSDDLRRVQPIYETVPGWEEDVTGMRTLQELPAAARHFLDRVSELIGRPVAVVSVGPDREQTIFTSDE